MAHAPLSSPGLVPVRTRTNDSSDYVLLSHERSPLLPPSTTSPHPLASTTPLPRPRFIWVLQFACAVDLLVVLLTGAAVPLSALPKSAVGLSVARPVFVAAVVSSKRVRAMGPLLLGQIMVSLLVLLYRVNELVQRSSTLSLLLSFHPSSVSLLPSLQLHLPALTHLLNATTRWYLLSFLFSLLHYALFAIFVGVRRRRNPFAGGVAGRGMRRSATWGEQEWVGREEVVGVPTLARSRTRTFSRTSRGLGSGSDGAMSVAEGETDAAEGEIEEELEDDNDDERTDLDDTEASSSEDEDDIIDIPRNGAVGGGAGALRNRASRASLLSVRGGGEGRSPPLSPPDAERPPGLRASRGFGSVRSLAGI
ncbi:hypothetical protein JCM6882_004093 [Rhodosporidiobolus microsporus]